MPTRKYISEFGLNMVNMNRVILQQGDFSQLDGTDFEPHIYFVMRRPKITLIPESVIFTNSTVSGRFNKQIRDTYIEIPFSVPNNLDTSNVVLTCEFPYTNFAISDGQGNVISSGKSADLLASFGCEFAEHLDLEILYIGQSYGADGDRTATERLQSHSTLQGIYSEAINSSPDQDIWLFLSEFAPQGITVFDGRSKNYETTIEEDTDHIVDVLENPVTEQQQINFAEAALIKYFQPSYNEKFKSTFPSPAHSSYSECYDIDLNSLIVEITTEDLMSRFWSEEVEPKWNHFCKFELHSRDERMSMFDFDSGNNE